MSGLVKPKKYDWKDSNLALFGSDTEKQVKKESAESEPAWQGAGQAPGLQIWRIVKFEVEQWPKEDYGKFYSGDSYIILNTYTEEDSEELLFDVHFWIGQYSSQDEYATAAYKTVELDTLLDDRAIQHREVQSHESEMFESYFTSMTIMQGGADTGFRHVTPEEYVPRLLHFSGTKKTVTVKEVPRCRSKLNSGDVFILDQGLQLYQWNGTDSNKDERFKAGQYLSELKGERGTADSEVLDEYDCSESHAFYSALDGEDEDDDEDETDDSESNKLFKASDASGYLDFSQVKEGDISQDDFDSNDVFMLDTPKQFFVWIGKGASENEKKNGFTYAHKQLALSNHSLNNITVIKEGQKNKDFEQAIAA